MSILRFLHAHDRKVFELAAKYGSVIALSGALKVRGIIRFDLGDYDGLTDNREAIKSRRRKSLNGFR
jgi:hypothetical protein